MRRLVVLAVWALASPPIAVDGAVTGVKWNKGRQNFEPIPGLRSQEAERREQLLLSRQEETHVFNGEPMIMSYYEVRRGRLRVVSIIELAARDFNRSLVSGPRFLQLVRQRHESQRNMRRFLEHTVGVLEFHVCHNFMSSKIDDSKIKFFWADLEDFQLFFLETVCRLVVNKSAARSVGFKGNNGSFSGILGHAGLNEIDIVPKMGAYSIRLEIINFSPVLWMNRRVR